MTQIWDATDPLYMRPFKAIFLFIACACFAWWVIPARNFCRKHKWANGELVFNNVPNALTVIRGAASLPIVTLFIINLCEGDIATTTMYFWIIIGLFLLDAVDGPLARMLNYMTQWGAKADPVADKVLIYSLALALPGVVLYIITPRFSALVCSLGMIVFLGWMGFVERRIVAISLQSNRLSIKTGINLHGAFGSGKAKFVTQTIGLATAYGCLIWASDATIGILVTCAIFVLARWFAEKSLNDHRGELAQLQSAAGESPLHVIRDVA
jgi:phosphatidylglycerophosphate synthase